MTGLGGVGPRVRDGVFRDIRGIGLSAVVSCGRNSGGISFLSECSSVRGWRCGTVFVGVGSSCDATRVREVLDSGEGMGCVQGCISCSLNVG